MTLLAVNGWDLSNYIMAGMAVIGPWFILWWWLTTVRRRFADLNQAYRERQEQEKNG